MFTTLRIAVLTSKAILGGKGGLIGLSPVVGKTACQGFLFSLWWVPRPHPVLTQGAAQAMVHMVVLTTLGYMAGWG